MRVRRGPALATGAIVLADILNFKSFFDPIVRIGSLELRSSGVEVARDAAYGSGKAWDMQTGASVRGYLPFSCCLDHGFSA